MGRKWHCALSVVTSKLSNLWSSFDCMKSPFCECLDLCPVKCYLPPKEKGVNADPRRPYSTLEELYEPFVD